MTETAQLLHLVFGGRVTDPQGCHFDDLSQIEFVGMYPNYGEAEKAWRAVSQKNVDDAMKKYWVVHLHRLMQPDELS